ncbi:helix-turn-helix domain-containing protein [Pseudomonas chlororaphis]|uniref:helix-turn-helix domain-containing protein n=1 Tax=Pseudomonas chlororaphis TaxID=587753 RepID=UPI0015DF2278|nr:helix-turn-helix transcriptional regulator [Pseudomonas chlororaphis]QLL13457.1 helix-turn-helix transcriptional regulator [Pseudomonas chlororaphis subsp. aurantiaca]
MRTIRILLGKQGGTLKVNGEMHPFPDCSLLIASDSVCPQKGGLPYFDFYESDFQDLYTELIDLIGDNPARTFVPQELRIINADEDVMRVMELLARGSRSMLLRFAYVYCLGSDHAYFSAFLRFLMCSDRSFIEFIETNKLMPWSVARFADEFGLPLRKFNMLFQEKFGISAKRWLMERRLQHARSLLLSSQMRILDIALECGFANHAHFTDSFRKRFLINPTAARLHATESHAVL